MVPMWEDFLVKASKFYNAVKQSAITADMFLDSFQKLADATTASKGATRDIGVSFTKLVMRHKSIEHKLRTYIGILTDSFLGPMQEKLEEWKKTAGQLEKDHSKDFKRAKGETKKSIGEVMKLRKKLVKKGRTEYHSQYKEAWKLANVHIDQLEDQEKLALRKLMLEERSRAVFFFNCYRPVVEQELSLISEIEHLQSLLEDTIKQCTNPSSLPLASEDLINNFKAPERAALPRTEASSPPPSPTLESARQRAFTSISKGGSTLHRSNTVSGATSGYSTLRKKGSGGPAPLPVGIPNPVKSPSKSSKSSDAAYDLESHESLNSSSGNVSNFSSMSSLSTASGDHIASDAGQVNQIPASYSDDMREQVAYYTQNDAKASISGTNGVHSVSSSNPATRTSWSSLETSDSSGIGSYISLNSQGHPHHAKSSGYHSDGQYEDDQPDYDYDEEINIQMANLNPGSVQMPPNFQSNFRRNVDVSSSMRGTRSSGAPYRRSNSLTEGESSMTDYRMNMPGRRSNTVYAKHPPSGAKPTAFHALAAGQSAAQLRSQLSPTGSPVKGVRPSSRKVSSPPNLYGGSSQQKSVNVQNRPGTLGLSDSSDSFERNSFSDSRPTSSVSANVITPVNQQNPSVYQPQSNDYAVPTTQPYQAKPDTPEDFPPPPPPTLLSQDSQQPEQHQGYQAQFPSQMNSSQYQVFEELRRQQQLQNNQPQHNQYRAQQQQHQQHQQHQYPPQQFPPQQFPQQQFAPQQFTPHQQQQLYQQHYQMGLQHAHYQGSTYQQQMQYPQGVQQQMPPQYPFVRRDSHSADDDMPEASPGSFLAQLQQKRVLVRSRTFSAGSSRSQSLGN